jgi:hypothetical protein
MSRIASYFNKADRKKLFFDYLKLIAILEIVIFIVIALWSSDDKYHRVYTPFPWKEYLFVAFAFPIMLTFLMGVIVTGFNHFLGQQVTGGQEEEAADKCQDLPWVLTQLKRLPLLAILFLLLVTIFALYNIHHVMAWLTSLTSSTFTFLSYVLAGAGVVVIIYMLFFLFFKYRLNQRQMKYQYYTQISDRHGLIILDDRTVLHKSGQLLVQGKRWGRPKPVKNAAVATRGPGRRGGPRGTGTADLPALGTCPTAGAQTLMSGAPLACRSSGCTFSGSAAFFAPNPRPAAVRGWTSPPGNLFIRGKKGVWRPSPAWERRPPERAVARILERYQPQGAHFHGFRGGGDPGVAAPGPWFWGRAFWRYEPEKGEIGETGRAPWPGGAGRPGGETSDAPAWRPFRGAWSPLR